jgi:PAS domain-containing protein
VLISSLPITIDGKSYIQEMVIDITDRKHAEDQLKQSEEFSFSILAHSPSPIYVIDKD